MAVGASSKVSLLLNALDSSYATEGASTGTPGKSESLMPTKNIFAATSNLSPSRSQGMRQALNATRETQMKSIADNMADIEESASQLIQNTPAHGGFRINYDFETPLRAIDVGGPDQTQRRVMSDFVIRSIDNLSHGLSVKKAMESLGLKNAKDLLPGMEVRLLSHQAIGVAWMVAQEQSRDRGGILADDMGLGKTVQMIATMVKNQPTLDEDCHTTLIVVPAALLLQAGAQWKEEVESKTNGVFTVHMHHGKDKLKKVSQVKDYDVIVTTYQTLNQDFVIPKDIDTAEEAEWLADNGGVLARARFYRAVADEAQFIRNRHVVSS
ncbi:hypothetical protein H0H87_008063 [Tephrocybe sp. NHM501043]|nr:hypothetical protein H0H87_008063 [Tephrocybe sp. NHM501043]